MNHKWVAGLKLLNFLLGIGSNSSKYSCAFGSCKKDKNGFWTEGDKRTISRINMLQNNWKKETNGDRKQLKREVYENCENECLINDYAGSEVISDICVIPALHTIKLGPVNKIYKELSTKVDLKHFEVNRYP